MNNIELVNSIKECGSKIGLKLTGYNIWLASEFINIDEFSILDACKAVKEIGESK